jgi:hypothetical protein
LFFHVPLNTSAPNSKSFVIELSELFLSVAQRKSFTGTGFNSHTTQHPTSLHAAERQLFSSIERLNGFNLS